MAEIDRPKPAVADDAEPVPRWGRLAFVVVGGAIIGLVPALFAVAAGAFWLLVIVLLVGGLALAFVRWMLGLPVWGHIYRRPELRDNDD